VVEFSQFIRRFIFGVLYVDLLMLGGTHSFYVLFCVFGFIVLSELGFSGLFGILLLV